jgi:hypothetical protein
MLLLAEETATLAEDMADAATEEAEAVALASPWVMK